MKRNILYPLFFLLLVVLLMGCNPSGSVKQTVILNLTNWSLPDTVKVKTPFNLALNAKAESSCISNIEFITEAFGVVSYKVYAVATYKSYNDNCNYLLTNKDTTLSGNFDQVGRYYFYFLKGDKWNKDSITIIP